MQQSLFPVETLTAKQRRAVACLRGGGLLLDRRYNGYAVIPAGPWLADALELGPRARLAALTDTQPGGSGA